MTDTEYQKEVLRTTMTKEDMGPFTKFLYHFAWKCQSPWGVMVDFDERRQRVYLMDKYYEWMHKLRKDMEDELQYLSTLERRAASEGDASELTGL